jgi:hypothetical protein
VLLYTNAQRDHLMCEVLEMQLHASIHAMIDAEGVEQCVPAGNAVSLRYTP